MIELKNISKVLSSFGIDYWVDSGSLLGIIRDGNLMPHDNDIDIGVQINNDKLTEEFIDSLINDYRVEIYKYKDMIVSVKFIRYRDDILRNIYRILPNKNENEYKSIDIRFYYNSGDKLYNILPSFNNNNTLNGIKIKWFLFKKLLNNCTIINIDQNDDNGIFEFGAIVVPLSLLKEKVYHNNIGVRIPKYHYEYLEYRYGDWSTPVKNWDYKIDDRSFTNDKNIII